MLIYLKPSRFTDKEFIQIIKDILKSHGHEVYDHRLPNFPESIEEFDHTIIIPHIQQIQGNRIFIGIDLFGFVVGFSLNHFNDISIAVRGYTNIEFRSIDGMRFNPFPEERFLDYEIVTLGPTPDFLMLKTDNDEISKRNQIKPYKHS